MSKSIEWDWVSRELAAAKADKETQEIIVALLKELQKQRDKWEPTESEERDALDKLVKLVAGHSIAVVEETERWVPVVPGFYKIGNTVRVKNDAYEGARGIRDNGKRGRVVAARDGFVLVVPEDAPNAEIQYRHLPEKLELLR